MRPTRASRHGTFVSETRCILTAALVLLCLGSAGRAATTLTLSDCSNNEDVCAESLDAQVAFAVSGSALTLAVVNNTPESQEALWFRVNAIYFNVAEHVTGLTLRDAEGWSVEVSQDAYLAGGFLVGGFGWFDVRLRGGVGASPYQVYPGQTKTFTFDIAGAAPFTDTDFTTELSAPQGGHILSLVAAKFAGEEASGFGSVVPEPATLALVALGGLALFRGRRD